MSNLRWMLLNQLCLNVLLQKGGAKRKRATILRMFVFDSLKSSFFITFVLNLQEVRDPDGPMLEAWVRSETARQVVGKLVGVGFSCFSLH